MRPNYNGVKFYSKEDMSIGYYLKKADSIIFSFDKNSEYTDINAVIEFYNIQQLYDTSYFFKVWTKEEYQNRKQIVKSMSSTIGRMFSKINDSNWVDYENDVSINYIDDFWALFARFKVYERVKPESFVSYLKNQEAEIFSILRQEKIVNTYDEMITFVLRESSATAKILSAKYLNEESVNYYLPKSFRPLEYESIFQKYIDSDDVDSNILYLIMNAQSSSECPISDKLRLNARHRYEELLNDNQGNIRWIGRKIKLEFRNQCELIEFYEQDETLYITYDKTWFENHLDYPTILNIFIFIFDMVDKFGRSNLITAKSNTKPIVKLLTQKAKRSYDKNINFLLKSQTYTLQMKCYFKFLNECGINIENIFKWFFEEYLPKEFEVDGFFFFSSTATTALEKCKNLASEMEGVLKQFRMYVEDEKINRELYEISSGHLVVENIPSFIKNKYAYSNDKSTVEREMFLLFSDQAPLSFIERTKDKYSTLFELLINEKILYSDFEDYQKGDIDWLIEQGDLGLTKDGVVYLRKTVEILKDLYEHEVVCDYMMTSYKSVLDEMVRKGKLVRSSALFSKPEVDYLNYALNKSSFSNGLDLRNKYLHATYPMDTEVQYRDYVELLKIMVLIIIKINDEFCERDKMKTDKETIEKE